MKKTLLWTCFVVLIVLGSGCGFLGEDKKGGDDRGSDPKNEGTETYLIQPETTGALYA